MTDPNPPIPPTFDDESPDLDLDRQREARAEAAGPAPALKFGGQRYELPREMPLDVLEPLLDLPIDMALLWRVIQEGVKTGSNEQVAMLVIDFMVGNPDLPKDAISAVQSMARRLLGDSGYQALVSYRLTREDIGAIAKYVVRRYGVSLGEASGSSGSAESGGEPSNPTSPATTPDSTPDASGSTTPTPTSSERAD